MISASYNAIIDEQELHRVSRFGVIAVKTPTKDNNVSRFILSRVACPKSTVISDFLSVLMSKAVEHPQSVLLLPKWG